MKKIENLIVMIVAFVGAFNVLDYLASIYIQHMVFQFSIAASLVFPALMGAVFSYINPFKSTR